MMPPTQASTSSENAGNTIITMPAMIAMMPERIRNQVGACPDLVIAAYRSATPWKIQPMPMNTASSHTASPGLNSAITPASSTIAPTMPSITRTPVLRNDAAKA